MNKTRCAFTSSKTNFCKNINFDVKVSKTIVKKLDQSKYFGLIIDIVFYLLYFRLLVKHSI